MKTVLGSMNTARSLKSLTDSSIQPTKLMQHEQQKKVSSYDLSVQNLPQILLPSPKLGKYENSGTVGEFMWQLQMRQTETAQHTACREVVGCLATWCCREKKALDEFIGQVDKFLEEKILPGMLNT